MASDKSTGTIVAGCIAAPVLLVVGIVLHGWALSILWGWFIVPTFALPPLTVTAALGVALVASLFAHQYINNEREGQGTAERWAAAVSITLLRPLFCLAIGQVYRWVS